MSAPQMGYVYVLSTPDGYYKIGSSRNPSNRLSQITLLLPYELKQEFLFMCELGQERWSERQIQQRFAKKRTRGEWFKLSKKDLEWFLQNPLPIKTATSHACYFSQEDLEEYTDDVLLEEMVGLS